MRIAMSWSGGKDGAYALWRLQQEARHDVAALLTTVTEGYDRISMHGVRDALLQAQADALGLPLRRIPIPPGCPNDLYESRMEAAVRALQADGVEGVAFGDLFLQDIREYRERNCARIGIAPLFPIWQEPTQALARRMIAEGFRATLCCVDPRKVAPAFAGRDFDGALLDDLPGHVDPCGENGEFHTYVHDAPNMRAPIPFRMGEVVEREGFVFADLIPPEDGEAGAR
jgi:uncharacterized protein (TIGR00290 family)